MGNMVTRTWENFMYPELHPQAYGPTTFDPTLGIGPRKERVMIATEAELRAAKIPKKNWDFCAHKLLEIHRCKADNYPFMWRCKNEINEMNDCSYEDYILRMKEYERERRLLARQHRLQQEAAA